MVYFGDLACALRPGETVLDGLLRHDQVIPHSCRSGHCQSCLMQATQGSPNDEAKIGLKPTLAADGFFLACRAVPKHDLSVALPGSAVNQPVLLVRKLRLCRDVQALFLQVPPGFSCRAGQYINLIRPDDGFCRSYSIAGMATGPTGSVELELHVRALPDGRMSQWLHDAEPGTRLRARGPIGSCFYLRPADERHHDLLLAGTGTGLAPLFGVLRDALAAGHRGRIHLLHGALRSADLYYVDRLRDLARRHANLTYSPCALEENDERKGIRRGALEAMALTALRHLRLDDLHAYFCGAPEMVRTLKKQTFLAGVSAKTIFSDPFVTAPSPGGVSA